MIDQLLLLNWWVATGTLLLEIAVALKLISLIILTFTPGLSLRKLINEVSENILKKFNFDVLSEKFLLVCIFLFSLSGTVLSLVYSEYFGQVPCALCWFQRIFMYGIVVLSGLPLLASPYKIEEQNKLAQQKYQLRNVLVFSILGAGFALYQHAEQILALYGTSLPCPVSGADCAKMTIFEYGHITFPWLAFVFFTFFIITILLQRKLK